MPTTFCPVCGAENPSSVTMCGRCGAAMDAEQHEAAVRPPLRPVVMLVAFAAIAAGLCLVHFVGALERFSFRPRVELRIAGTPPLTAQESEVLRGLGGNEAALLQSVARMLGADVVRSPVARGGLVRLLGPTALFFLGGLLAAVAFRRRAFREIGLAAALAALLQAVLWAQSLDWRLDLLIADQLFVVAPTSVHQLPSGFFLLVMLAFFWLAAVAGGALGAGAVERLTGRATCPACGGGFVTRPMPLACPRCRTALARGRVRWTWAVGGTALTVALFSLVLGIAGPKVPFYDRCRSDEPTEACRTARRETREAGRDGSSWRIYVSAPSDELRRSAQVVVFHPWKYLLWTSPVFFLAPLLLGWRLRRGALATAGTAIPLGWLAATVVAFVPFGLAGFEGAFVESLRFHLLAAVLWGVVGAAGAFLGNRLPGAVAAVALEDLED